MFDFEKYRRKDRKEFKIMAISGLGISIVSLIICLILRDATFVPVIFIGTFITSLALKGLKTIPDPDKKD